MPSITSAGIGSGFDIESLITGLMTIEQRPLTIIAAKQEKYAVQISAYGNLVSGLSTFQSAVKNLSTAASFPLYTSSSSDSEVVAVTTTSNSPDIGSYDVEVLRVADTHKMASTEFDNTATFGGGVGDEISVQVGADIADVVSVDLSTAKTLAEIRDAINDDADNPGVTATLINGDGIKQKLVLTSNDTGEAKALTLAYGGAITSTTLNLATLNDIGGDLSLLDASLEVDGYAMTRASNTVTDVIDGVSLSLVKADVGNTHKITVALDNTGITEKVQAFADAYSTLRDTIRTLRNGDLGNDSALSSIENQMLGVLNTNNTDGAYKYLSDVGLSIQKDGSMDLDSSKLATALTSNFDDVVKLFSTKEKGFANRLDNKLDSWIQTNGLLDSRTDGLNDRLDDLADQKLSIERRLLIVEARYRTQFAALDTLVGSLSNTGSFLTNQLANLPGPIKSK